MFTILIKTTTIMQESNTPNPSKPEKTVDMFVWNQIEEELRRRRLSKGWLWRGLDSSRQVIYGWKIRGIPEKRLKDIAALLGWSLERLTTGSEATAVQPAPSELPESIPLQVGQYSPMAMELAAMLDNIQDAQQRRMTYALLVQFLVLSNPPLPGAPGPGAQQMTALHHGQ